MLATTLLPDRIAAKIVTDPTSGCWTWAATRNSSGYGSVWWNGRMLTAHRVVYELLVGPIPEGLQLDHLCRVRHCVNPGHLEPVTNKENVMRGEHRNVRAHIAGVCVSGRHVLAGDNIYSYGHGRQCRECHLEAKRRRPSRSQTLANDTHHEAA